MSPQEIGAIVYLGERLGNDLDVTPMRRVSPGIYAQSKGFVMFKELKEIFEKDSEEREQLLKDFENKYDLPEPNQAAYMFEIGGYALDFLIYYYIKIDQDVSSLYGTFTVMSHEFTHTMLYNEMDIGYGAEFLFSYLNWTDNEEIVTIHETACDVMADKVSELFIKNDLPEGSELYNESVMLRELFANYDTINQKVVSKYKSYSDDERLYDRESIFSELSDIFFEETGYRRAFNEAKLAMMMQYSGNKDVRPKLEHLLDTVGPNMFLELVPYMYHNEDIDTIQKRADKGMSFFEIVAPIARRECPIKEGDITF